MANSEQRTEEGQGTMMSDKRIRRFLQAMLLACTVSRAQPTSGNGSTAWECKHSGDICPRSGGPADLRQFTAVENAATTVNNVEDPTVHDVEDLTPLRQRLNRRSPLAARHGVAFPIRSLLVLEEDPLFHALSPSAEMNDDGLCMSSKGNETIVARQSDPEEADPCRFTASEVQWEAACSHPYFGGSFRCCFDARNGTCSMCSASKTCAPSSSLHCAQRSDGRRNKKAHKPHGTIEFNLPLQYLITNTALLP